MRTGLPHFLINKYDNNSYIPVGGGSSNSSRPPRQREQHSQRLKQNLLKAWDESENEQVIHHSDRNGIYLEFRGEPGYELVTRSLENMTGNRSNWTRLLNVRTEQVGSGDGEETIPVVFATVYVPHSKKDALFSKITQYASEETQSGHPKNAKLLESISSIQKALEIKSFWRDDADLIPNSTPEWCEVWLSSDFDEVIESFEALLKQLNIEFKPDSIKFPERSVKLVLANCNNLEMISRLSDNIAEFRKAKQTAAFWLNQSNKEQESG